MYLRESRRTNRDGSVVGYLQLAHNQRHPQTGTSTAKVIHNFGRADQVDRDALARLVASISRYLTPEQAAAAAGGGEVEVLDSRRLGGAWTLDRLWERLGIGAAIRQVAAGRRLDGDAVERVVFALVAQRALEPGSKLAATRWVAERVAIDGLAGLTDDQAYRAMDFLLDALDEIAGRSSTRWRTCSTSIWTSSSWTPPPPTGRSRPPTSSTRSWPDPAADDETTSPAEAGARAFGHSKDHRDDLPQVVIAMAVTRDGIPVRCWTFPGDTADTAIIRTVKDDLGGWGLRRLVWVADRGFASAANRAYLTRGGGHYIHAEKLRHTNTEAAAALARPGPLPHRRGQPAGQGGPRRPRRGRGRRRRRPHAAVRGLPQPRSGRAGPAGPGQPGRPLAAADRRLRRLDAAAARRARRLAEDQARAAPLPAPHPGRAAAHRPRRDQAGAAPGRQVAAAHLRPHPHPRRPRRRLQAAARRRTRLAGHEGRARAAPGVPPPRGPHPRPRAAVLAGAAAASGSSRTPPATPGATSATNSTACTWSPWPPTTAGSRNAPRLTAGHKTILAALGLPEPAPYFDFTPPPTDRPTPAQPPRRVVTRPSPAKSGVSPAQRPDSA